MAEQSEADSLRDQILQQMQAKETEELIAIWRKNDEDTWTDEAMVIIEEILIQRLGKLPDLDSVDDEADEDKSGARAVKYPTDKRLIWIAELSGRLSWVILAVAIIYAGLQLVYFFSFQSSYSGWPITYVVWDGLLRILIRLSDVLYAGFAFLVLQAVTEVIYLLMDIRDFVQPEQADPEAQIQRR
jgi:hypothetical protein